MNHFGVAGNLFNVDTSSGKKYSETLQGSLETESKTINIHSLFSDINYEGVQVDIIIFILNFRNTVPIVAILVN